MVDKSFYEVNVIYYKNKMTKTRAIYQEGMSIKINLID